MNSPFSFATTPQLHFGTGALSVLPSAIKTFGKRALLVTGSTSFVSSTNGPSLFQALTEHGIDYDHFVIRKEPGPADVDRAVQQFSSSMPGCVIAIGGGSALDAGKAISAMLRLQEPAKIYLEGIGSRSHPGTKIPFIAIPTTSGTGSEATKNAVLSETGPVGFKRSLRHNNFVPDIAIVDPLLTLSCSPATTAASGMDAFTQLLESYLSTASSPMTDALALEGLRCIERSLQKSYRDGSDREARTDMAFAAYLSGLTLANAGLGVVHGFASPIGGYFGVSHGVICSALMGASNQITVRKLRFEKRNDEALKKYATVGKIFSRTRGKSEAYYIDLFLETIDTMASEMHIPRLAACGIQKQHFNKIVAATGNKNNPVALTKEEMVMILELSL